MITSLRSVIVGRGAEIIFNDLVRGGLQAKTIAGTSCRHFSEITSLRSVIIGRGLQRKSNPLGIFLSYQVHSSKLDAPDFNKNPRLRGD